MRLENSFDVPAPIASVWSYLLDVEKVVPCMPGAELTEAVDQDNYKGKLNFKLGPVSLSFAGTVTMVERDEGAHRLVMRGRGMEQRGKGAASATVTSTLEPFDGGTRVTVVQDVQVQGQAAQMARGMMQDVSAKLTQQFADCLQARMAPGEGGTGAAQAGDAPVEAKPVGGIRLLLGAFGRAVGRFFSRLFRRRPKS
jgi:carbon monoxide dehydrogenase subunit G